MNTTTERPPLTQRQDTDQLRRALARIRRQSAERPEERPVAGFNSSI